MILTLTRDPIQPQPYCTMGVLAVGTVTLQTVERPWWPGPAGTVCGEQGTSCIGAGLYDLMPRNTEAKGDHWILTNPALGVYQYPASIPSGVYARSLVLIHAANWAHELLGCIAPGLSREVMNGELGVTSSQIAMSQLRLLLSGATDLQLDIH